MLGSMLAVALIALPAAAAHGQAARLAPIKKLTQSTSSNWAGVAATGGGFTNATSSWTQPTASCTGATTYSSFWVGLDGDGSNTVEQTGTDADCSGGTPSYYAWYEMYPKYPVNLGLSVRPGDVLTATVTYVGSNRFSISITDSRSG